MRLFYALYLIVLFLPSTGSAQENEVQEAPPPWKPPLVCFESRAYGDGGTLGIGIRDAEGKATILCCTEDCWEGSLVPHNTLLLDAWHFNSVNARLPRDEAEANRVLAMLRAVASQDFTEVEIKAVVESGKYPEDWRERNGHVSMALSALRRISSRERVETYDRADGKERPAWWRGYDRDRQERYKKGAEARRRDAEFQAALLGCFDPSAHALFDLDYGWIMSIEVWDPDPRADDEATAERAGKLLAAYKDHKALAKASLHALSINGEDWDQFDSREAIAIEALYLIDAEVLAQAVAELNGKKRATLGCIRALFPMRLATRLPDKTWAKLVTGMGDSLIREHDDDWRKLEVVAEVLRRRDLPESRALIKRVMRGDYSEQAREVFEVVDGEGDES